MACDRYNSYKTNVSFIPNSYEGIPLNLLINVIVYLILIGVFLILRKRAWNYGDIAWFTKPINIMSLALKNRLSVTSSDKTEEHEEREKLMENSKNRFIDRFWKALPLFIKISDQDLEKRCGCDAVIYCKFQRMLLLISTVMVVAGLIIIVPLNLSGHSLSKDTSSFKTLTIANIGTGSKVLSVHLIVAFLLMIFVFFISNKFLKYVDDHGKEKVSYSLMITRVPLEACDESLIEQHFREIYPEISNMKVQRAYEIECMINLYISKVLAEEALEYCVDELEHFNRRVKVAPNVFGRMCIACKCCEAICKPIDGIEYYMKEVKRTTELFNEEQKKTLKEKKLPIFFVSFDSIEHALLIRREYIYQNYCCIKPYPKSQSSLSKILNSDNWKVIFAPISKDILWENLHKKGWKLWVKIILINSFVALLVITLSTPSMIIKFWNDNFQSQVKKIYSSWGSQFFPSIVMVLVTATMPLLICLSNEISAHQTRTKQSIAIMNKLFTVLTVTVLILPSLGLNSAQELMLQIFNRTNASIFTIFKWDCIFLYDGGALFCNYLISAGFIGMGLEILRIGPLFLFMIKMSTAKSEAENNGIAQSLLWEFPYGINYAWTLALFSIISAYSVIVPLITPFGLVYLVSKHMVDRYNMVHVFIPAVIESSVHVNASKLLQICLIFTQATVTIYVFFRAQGIPVIFVFCLLVFSLGILLTIGRSVRRSILSMAWIKYSEKADLTDQTSILKAAFSKIRIPDKSIFSPIDHLKRSILIPQSDQGENHNFLIEQMQSRMSVTLPGNPFLMSLSPNHSSKNEGNSIS